MIFFLFYFPSCLLSTDAANESNDDVQKTIDNNLDNSAKSDKEPNVEVKSEIENDQLRTTDTRQRTASENEVFQKVKDNDKLNVISESKPLSSTDEISTNEINSENIENV